MPLPPLDEFLARELGGRSAPPPMPEPAATPQALPPLEDFLAAELGAGGAAQEPAQPPEPTGLLGRLQDYGADAVKGAVNLGQSLIGIGDMATGGYLGEGMRAVGYDPKRANEILESGYSPERQAEEQAIKAAQGFTGAAGAMLANPGALAGRVVETLPNLLGSVAAARTLAARAGGAALARGATQAEAALAAEKAATLGASAAEGLQQAGSAFEGAIGDGVAKGLAYAEAIGSGTTTALAGRAMGALGRRVGLGDVDAGVAAKGGLVARGLKGGAQETLEETPQSATETAWANFSRGQPLGKGVPEAAGQGAVIGFAAGAPMSALRRGEPEPPPGADPGTPAGTPGSIAAANELAARIEAENAAAAQAGWQAPPPGPGAAPADPAADPQVTGAAQSEPAPAAPSAPPVGARGTIDTGGVGETIEGTWEHVGPVVGMPDVGLFRGADGTVRGVGYGLFRPEVAPAAPAAKGQEQAQAPAAPTASPAPRTPEQINQARIDRATGERIPARAEGAFSPVPEPLAQAADRVDAARAAEDFRNKGGMPTPQVLPVTGAAWGDGNRQRPPIQLPDTRRADAAGDGFERFRRRVEAERANRALPPPLPPRVEPTAQPAQTAPAAPKAEPQTDSPDFIRWYEAAPENGPGTYQEDIQDPARQEGLAQARAAFQGLQGQQQGQGATQAQTGPAPTTDAPQAPATAATQAAPVERRRTGQPWEMSLDDFQKQYLAAAIEKYGAEEFNDAAVTASYRRSAEREWLKALDDRALVGRISDAALDSYVALRGVAGLQGQFRGVREAGINGYSPPDVRAQKGARPAPAKDATQKAPWERTWAEHKAVERLPRRQSPAEWRAIHQSHRDAVARAVVAGRPVPPEVLADYPDLAQRTGDGIPSAAPGPLALIPPGATVRRRVQIAGTDQVGTIEQDAREALAEIDGQISALRQLVKCLSAAA